ncbi:AfsR/SARP family transcriptional regulator [Nocardiopsis alba]|jgi:DNA-binding SARP family transcriptional activator|uniref:AfsR/SARP family transcriptional regulator n=2 Tax=Nocardiopsis alba TaxID=53437 RepID=UPI0033BDFEBB
MIKFTVLGSLEIQRDDRTCRPSAPKVMQVLSLLLLRSNRALPISTVIEELWGEHPPRSASTTTQTYIYQLRRLLEHEGFVTEGEELLVTHPYGYQLQIEPRQLDAFVFESLLNEGRRLLARGREEEAVVRLRSALSLWTGPILPHVTRGPLLSAHAIHLEEQWLRTTELCIQAEIRLGWEREVIGELRALSLSHPLNEWFHVRLVEALARAGRRNEALEAYQRARTILDEELGLSPSAELQALQVRLLSGTPEPLPESLLRGSRGRRPDFVPRGQRLSSASVQ